MTAAEHRTIDVLIVGQGLAGTALAWELLWRQRSFLMIDREDSESSSRVAAGLITPVTGRRFVRSNTWSEDRQTAERFYERVSETLSEAVFEPQTMIRLFASSEERKSFEQKSHMDHPQIELLSEREFATADLNAPWGGFAMRDAGRLNVTRYLDLSREYFRLQGCYSKSTFDDSSIDPEKPIPLDVPNISAERVIFCQGFAAASNRWFSEIPFDATQGEILTVNLPGWREPRVVHRGIWIAPQGDATYRIGATHQREPLDGSPTEQGRRELIDALREILPRSCRVIDQRAAVRPILKGRQPAMGMHPVYSRLGFFNGLGSKGSLLAPRLAHHLAGFLNDEHELSKDYDLNRRWRLSP